MFLLLGLERVEIDPGNTVVTPLNFVHYPLTHSFLGVIAWAVLLGLVYFLLKKNWRSSIWLGLLVISHWILDLFTHRPDLQIVPWSETRVGLELWSTFIGTILLEGSLFAAGVYLYLKATRARNRTGIWALWSLVAFLVIIYINNLFGPPPPSAEPIGYVGLLQWLLVLWGYWIDRNRALTTKPIIGNAIKTG
jgi:hypothetical protein